MNLVYAQDEFLLLVSMAFLCGVLMGIIFDALRLMRMLIGVSKPYGRKAELLYLKKYPLVGKINGKRVLGKRAEAVLTFIFDLLFMLACGAIVLVLLFFLNDGKFRVIVPIVSFVGFLCYYISIGRTVSYFSALLTLALRLSIAYIKFICLLPLRLCVKLFKIVFSYIYRIFARKRMKTLSDRYEKELISFAKEGFFLFGKKNKAASVFRSVGGKNGTDKKEKEV